MEQNWLASIEDFLAVAAHGGLNAASRATQVPKATLSRRLQELETALDTRLVERGGHRLGLTDEGRFLLERAAPLVAELQQIGEAVSDRGRQPSGPLRISVPGLFAQTRLSAIAAGFVARYPEVTLHIDVSDEFVDPALDGYDMVVRVNPKPDTDLVGKCFLRSEMVVAAPPSLRPPASGEVPVVVISSLADLAEWTARGEQGLFRIVPRPVMVCSSMMLVYHAIIEGVGCGLVPRWLIEDDVRAGRLALWGVVPNLRAEAWVLHTSRRLTSPKVRAFVDALVEAHRPE
ncbi:LysR family transcriptional regulator [Sphingomonas sp. DT-207]